VEPFERLQTHLLLCTVGVALIQVAFVVIDLAFHLGGEGFVFRALVMIAAPWLVVPLIQVSRRRFAAAAHKREHDIDPSLARVLVLIGQAFVWMGLLVFSVALAFQILRWVYGSPEVVKVLFYLPSLLLACLWASRPLKASQPKQRK